MAIHFKLARLALLTAAACAAGAAQAAPINPTRIIYISGSSALDPAIIGSATSQLCAGGTAQTYSLNGATSDHYALYCNTLDSSELPSGSSDDIRNERLLIVKRSAGGSAWGITPVAGLSSEFLGVTVDANGAIEFINPATCDDATLVCTGTHQHRAQAGFSDVDAYAFDRRNGALRDVARYPRIATLGFGVGVSEALYNHLVSVRGVGVLTRSDFAALLSTNPDYPTFEFITGSRAQVEICRGGLASGIQWVANAYFLGQNCVSADAALVAASPSNPAGRIVTEAANAERVRTCLVNADAAGRYAIGVVPLTSAENQGGSNGNNWRWGYDEGSRPNLHPVTGAADPLQKLALIEGAYDFAFEAEAYRATRLPAASLPELGSGHVQAVMDRIVGGLRSLSGPDQRGVAIVHGELFYEDAPTRVVRFSRGGDACSPLGRT